MTNKDTFTPYNSGSLAWLLLGGNSTTPLSVVDMTSISEASRTFNSSGWFDLRTDGSATTAYLTQLASVLLCDPNITYGNAELMFSEGVVTSKNVSQSEQGGQINHIGAEWMFGMGLDGIPFDTVLTQLPLFNTSDASGTNLTNMSQLVFDLTMRPPAGPGLGATLQEAVNISASLNTYMSVVGANVFLDGSLGSQVVHADVIVSDGDKQQFSNSWFFWSAGMALVAVISILLIFMIMQEGDDFVLSIENVLKIFGRPDKETSD